MCITCQEDGLYALHLPGVTCHAFVDEDGGRPRRRGEMVIVAWITEPEVIDRILGHR